MIQLNNIFIPLDGDFKNLKPYVAEELHISVKFIKNAVLLKKSVDARNRSKVRFCCSIAAEISLNEQNIVSKNKNAVIYEPKQYVLPICKNHAKKPPVIVGFGPAGIFCALILAKCGLNPIVLERGNNIDRRTADVTDFFKGKPLDPESNVQFGEGGAGTFSDGKLNTGIKDMRCREVLNTFVQHGAQSEILYDSKPHIGTDILKNVIKNIRNEITALGGKIYFSEKVNDIIMQGESIKAVKTASGKIIETDALIMAIGHSARDTFAMLKEKNVQIIKKPFSVGLRIEHLQSDINKALYGKFATHKALGAADYKMAVHLQNGRGVYTFCMCPGGNVINSSSENNGIAVNGMSYSARNGKNANSAVLVSIEPEDLKGNDVLAGCEFQRNIEQTAYRLAHGNVPVSTVGAFLKDETPKLGRIIPTVLPKYEFCDFNKIFPDFVSDSLKQGISAFGKKIKGFDVPDAVLTAPETRSSSPVRILRNQDGISVNIKKLFPCGEGAGYAGGIMSAAVDGIKTAEAVVRFYNNE